MGGWGGGGSPDPLTGSPNDYQVDNVVGFVKTYLLDSDLSSVIVYPAFKYNVHGQEYYRGPGTSHNCLIINMTKFWEVGMGDNHVP